MSTQLFIVFLSSLAGIMGGLTLSKRTQNREKYFDELVRIVERLFSDIKFSQQKIEDILAEYNSVSSSLAGNLAEYTAFLRGGELKISKGILTKREHRLVSEFFLRLGSLDLDTQLGELESRRQVFEEFKTEARAKQRGFGRAFIKLGFLAGLLVGILII